MLPPQLTAALLALTGASSAAAEPRWDPGERSTARVEPEVSPDTNANDAGGVYGRFDGDLDVGVHAGVELGGERPAGAFLLTLHHLSTAGPYLAYVDGFGQDEAPARTVAVGVELRPTFLPRWSENRESGSPLLDLAIDSIAIGVGGFWSKPSATRSFGDRRGFETSLRLAFPLLGRPTGPWIGARGLLRFPDPGRGAGWGREEAVMVALAWQTLVDAPW